MASLRIEFKRSAEHDLRGINPKLVPNILRRLELLTEEPRPRQALKLAGTDSLYRLRVGDYRVIYEIDIATNSILVFYVRHRREAYRGLS